MTTRDAILWESLVLFSTNGFDAVSTRMIARAVNASDAVIYKHFKSKQEILDTIIETCKKRFVEKRDEADYYHICWNDVEKICMDMFRFQTEDEWIVLFRKLLIVEQFKNKEMAKLYQLIFIDYEVDGLATFFQYLMDEGYLRRGNPKVYAMELYAPFYMYHMRQMKSENLLKDLEEHVTYFRKNYRIMKEEN